MYTGATLYPWSKVTWSIKILSNITGDFFLHVPCKMENFVTTTCEFSLRVPRTYKYILYADHYMYGSALCVCQCNGHCSLSITKHAGPASLQYFNMGIGWSNNF